VVGGWLVLRPEQAIGVERGVNWYVCKERWCPNGGEEAIYMPVRIT